MKSSEKSTPNLQSHQITDTHCHLDMDAFSADLDEVLDRATQAGVSRIISIGIDLVSSKKAIALAEKYPQIFATIGIHPHDVDQITVSDYDALEKLYCNHFGRIVGYGEIGLDYYKQYSDPSAQKHHFTRQLELAHELKLPVVVHNRDADEDILRILTEAKPLIHGGIMHCFSSNLTFARKIIDLGMLVSIPGVVTFKNSHVLQEVVQNIPLNSMILETDGPFLAPHPFRGKRNEPSYLLHTAMKIAELRQTDLQTIANQTSANAEKIFSFAEVNQQ